MYPALVAAEATLGRRPGSEFSFVGSVGGFERPLVEQSGLPLTAYHEVQAGPFAGVSPLRAINSTRKLVQGSVQALRILARHQPDVIFSTGGWVSFPVALAAWLRRIPLVIYLPDVEPGATIKTLKRFAVKVAVTSADSAPYFTAEQMVVTGYPLRRALITATRQAGVEYFQLDPIRKTILVFGGSTGARSINVAVINLLPQLMERRDVQMIHVIGDRDWERAQEQLAGLTFDRTHYHPYPYLHDEMGSALAVADLVINRSGASVLGELTYFGLPSLLIPYPHAWRYQKVNADVLAGRGAALRIEDEDMARVLLPTICELLDDPVRLAQMSTQANVLAQRDAADRIADVLIGVVEQSQQEARRTQKDGRA